MCTTNSVMMKTWRRSAILSLLPSYAQWSPTEYSHQSDGKLRSTVLNGTYIGSYTHVHITEEKDIPKSLLIRNKKHSISPMHRENDYPKRYNLTKFFSRALFAMRKTSILPNYKTPSFKWTQNFYPSLEALFKLRAKKRYTKLLLQPHGNRYSNYM